jgi:two-component system sensor histidine kinase KdpD
VPLRTAGHAVGLLRLVRAPGLDFAEEDSRLLETFATQAALAIERARFAAESAQAAVLRESDRAKSALLSSVSHELRTPLATIRGAADALRQPLVAADVAMHDELIASIAEESERLSVLVTNLLDLSRIEAGALHPQRHLYDLAEIASQVAARLAPRLANHRLVLDLPHGGLLVPVDYLQIDGVLANLLDNAAKYTPPDGAIALRLSRENGCAVLSVEDEGPGIAPAHRRQVFTKFYRVPGEETRATPGIGLGLAICKGVVEAHDGTICALDSSAGGARLEVRLPLIAAEYR